MIKIAGDYLEIFISWSGQRSQVIAEALRDWIPNVIQNIEPWTSSSDIEAGKQWAPALSERLQQIQFGIICLTPENLNAPWILFEAGALSKIIHKASVCPYLLALEPTDVIGPLAQFQSVKADTDGTKKLLKAINHAQKEQALPEDRLNRSIEAFWPSLEKRILHVIDSQQGKMSNEEDREFLKYLKESRIDFIQLEARMVQIGHQAETKWDDEMLKSISISGFELLDSIEHEKDNLSIFTSKVMSSTNPIIESRKMEYLHNLRLLRIATRNLMIPQYRNRKEETRQFEIARGEALTARDLLSNALETALK